MKIKCLNAKREYVSFIKQDQMKMEKQKMQENGSLATDCMKENSNAIKIVKGNKKKFNHLKK